MTTLRVYWDQLRSSFWFIPAMGLLLGLVLAEGMVRIDRAFFADRASDWWLATTPDASRSLLSTLSGALVSVTALVFSITMLTLSQTASSYGGRLLRTFLDRLLSQVTLGSFLGTAIYCIWVLRTVRELEAVAFTPHLATATAIGLSLGCMGLLVAFINYTAQMLQPSEILASVSKDITKAIERIYPAGLAEPPVTPPADPSFPGADRREIRLGRAGYLQAVTEEALLEQANAAAGLVRLRVRPGLFVSSQTVVAEVLPAAAADDEVAASIADAFVIGTDRTPRQDIEAALLELVEVAVRALSPGINDPRTAITATHYLSDAFVRLAGRPFPSQYRAVDGELRLIMPRERFGPMLAAAFTAILHYSGDFGPNIEAIIEAAGRINNAIVLAADPGGPAAASGSGDAPAEHDRPHDLDEKRAALTDLLQLVEAHVAEHITGPARDRLRDQSRQVREQIAAHADSTDGDRAADSLATAMQAVRDDGS